MGFLLKNHLFKNKRKLNSLWRGLSKICNKKSQNSNRQQLNTSWTARSTTPSNGSCSTPKDVANPRCRRSFKLRDFIKTIERSYKMSANCPKISLRLNQRADITQLFHSSSTSTNRTWEQFIMRIWMHNASYLSSRQHSWNRCKSTNKELRKRNLLQQQRQQTRFCLNNYNSMQLRQHQSLKTCVAFIQNHSTRKIS